VSVIAVDIGSSRIKALLAEWDGLVLEIRARPTPHRAVEPGERSYPADAVQAAIESLVAGLAADHPTRAIDTLVFACLGTAMIPLDADERPLGPALAPADTRPLAGPGLAERVGMSEAELYRRTGSDPRAASFLRHALWWQGRSDVMRRLHRFRSLRGYALSRLCGSDVEEPSWASRTMLLELETNRWSDAILDAAGLPPEVLPPLAPSTSRWPVLPAARERLGLARDAVVVLGGMDNCCSVLGATKPRGPDLVNIVGTFEHMAAAGELERVRTVAAAADAIVHAYVLPGCAIGMTRVLLGDLLQAVAAGSDVGLPQLLDGVSATPRGRWIGLDGASIRAAIDAGEPRVEVLQAVLETAAGRLKRYADAWGGGAGAGRRVIAVGGGTSQPAALQLKANVLQRPVSLPASAESAGLGALRLAAMATEDLSLDAACRRFPNPVTTTFRPRILSAEPRARLGVSTP
jgi:xylulokinase